MFRSSEYRCVSLTSLNLSLEGPPQLRGGESARPHNYHPALWAFRPSVTPSDNVAQTPTTVYTPLELPIVPDVQAKFR